MTDHLLLRREGSRLFAELDYAAHGRDSPLPRWHAVDAFARCLREDETERAFGAEAPNITEVDLETFIRASGWNIGFPLDASNIDKRLAEREPIFRSLVADAVEHFVLVPWMETLEGKATLIRAHFS